MRRFTSSASRFLSRSKSALFSKAATQASTLFKNRHFQRVALATATVSLGAATTQTAFCDASVDFKKVRAAIVTLLEDEKGNYDGNGMNHYGPLFIRLAWHASGTYSCKDRTGGSDGATMRFAPECQWGANAGLGLARDRLAPLLKQFPGLTAADLWTMAGAVAVEEMGGPQIKWRSGRSDAPDNKKTVPDGRLPDAAQGAQHIRDIFYRMGFNDREIVALSGAHALGRCHTDRSGFKGPWTRAPTTFSNDYFRLLLEENWTVKQWDGPKQYENSSSGRDLMMLETDLALVRDPEFKKYVQLYAKDEKVFFQDFSSAFSRLLELGVKFDGKSCPAAGGASLSLNNGTLVALGFLSAAATGIFVGGKK